MRDMQILPKLSDSISFLYLEQVVIHRNQNTVEAIDKDGRIIIPVASLSALMLGPGVSISHAAINILAKNGCNVVWVGEDTTRFYASGMGESYKAYKVIHQAELVSNPDKRKDVVLKMYLKRFDTHLDRSLSLPQIRGLEGVRVRNCYQEWSQKTGVEWQGRSYNFQQWGGDPINKALSTANAVMNAICTTVIISAGYSSALGFIHQGRQYSFVYDVADLYKTAITIPAAFEVTGEGTVSIEKRTRLAMRQKIKEKKLIERVLSDIDELFGSDVKNEVEEQEEFIDPDQMYPFPLWEQLFDKKDSEL